MRSGDYTNGTDSNIWRVVTGWYLWGVATTNYKKQYSYKESQRIHHNGKKEKGSNWRNIYRQRATAHCIQYTIKRYNIILKLGAMHYIILCYPSSYFHLFLLHSFTPPPPGLLLPRRGTVYIHVSILPLPHSHFGRLLSLLPWWWPNSHYCGNIL